ncbi:aminoglycoside phosphotransferase family protein [Szabonella alba]|uniref:Phosphotransferase n=1 Tax=Szabonella alba TaxID=2804194 RepID=A0A8K0V702_9RHOB|nr:phosphotransferase [Szabonella alba]MBL4916612.1 phosphotransferase [Szabonella alba]
MGPDRKAPDRKALSQDFLNRAGWGGAARHFLAGDASDRSYDRLRGPLGSAVLMDAPPGRGDDPADFIAIADHLRGIGLSAPAILARDLPNGFLLIEDLGDALLARLVKADPGREATLYAAATDVLAHLQSHAAPPGLPDLSAADWADAAGFAPDWYGYAATGQRPDSAAFRAALTAALRTHADGPRVLILRDYHAENLLWLPERQGVARVGLLDFQLGQMGQPGYDLVSLLQDARRDVLPVTEAAMIDHFAAARGLPQAGFAASYAVLGAQRALRILGIFARLCLVAGKARYLAMIPRVWDQLQRNLAHPALVDLAPICAEILPPPTPEVIERIAGQCGTRPE